MPTTSRGDFPLNSPWVTVGKGYKGGDIGMFYASFDIAPSVTASDVWKDWFFESGGTDSLNSVATQLATVSIGVYTVTVEENVTILSTRALSTFSVPTYSISTSGGAGVLRQRMFTGLG